MALPVGEFLALEHGLEYWGIADHDQVKVTDFTVISVSGVSHLLH